MANIISRFPLVFKWLHTEHIRSRFINMFQVLPTHKSMLNEVSDYFKVKWYINEVL